jgi:lysophospholipase L1-like esterase
VRGGHAIIRAVSIRDSRRANVTLALLSMLGTLFLLVLGYEVAANVRYYRWRRSFDNAGWIGALTVRSADPALIWEYRPYGRAAGITTNRWGFRDVDYPTPAKPAGIHRIAFIGDSITLGMGVEPGQTFVHLVEERAVAAGYPVQALNFAVDGYHTLQLRELLTAKVLAFEPDEVVYVMCLNDFDFSDSSGRKISYFRRPWLFLPQDVERRYRSLRGIEFHHWHFGKNRDAVFRAILEMKDILANRHGDFLLAVVPVFPTTTGDPAYLDHHPLVDLHRQILAFASRHDIRAHDLLEDFRREEQPPERFCLDLWHLSVEGHRVVAEGLLPILLPAAPGPPSVSGS